MSTFDSTDLFFLQRPSDTTDPYKAVSREAMKALGIKTQNEMPSNPDEGQLWFPKDEDRMYIRIDSAWRTFPSRDDLYRKVSKTGDSMTGDLVMLGDADVNFPVRGGLTLGSVGNPPGHMILITYENLNPTGILTIPTTGGLETIAKWNDEGLYIFKDPIVPEHVTHKKYVDDENHIQDVNIHQNTTNILALFDDLESVRPSVVRAKYFNTIPVTYGDPVDPGRFYLGDGTNIELSYTDSVTEIYLNKKGDNGIEYIFDDINQDYYVEVQDIKGIGIILGEIVSCTDQGTTVKLVIDAIKYRDEGVLTGDPDPTAVRILIFEKNTTISIDDEDRFAKLYQPNTFTKDNNFRGSGVYLDSAIQPPDPITGDPPVANIFSVKNGWVEDAIGNLTPGVERFNINSGGEVTAGTLGDPFMANFDNDVATKKYVDLRSARAGVYYGDTPPAHPTPGLLWYDTKEDDLTMYMFYENPDTTTAWVPVYSPSRSSSNTNDNFVKKAGDTIHGAVFNYERRATAAALAADQSDDSDLRFVTINTRIAKSTDTGGAEDSSTRKRYGIRFKLDDGNSFKNTLAVNNRLNRFITISGGVDPAIEFNTNLQGSNWDANNQNQTDKMDRAGVKILGIPTPGPGAHETSAVNKKYVDDALDFTKYPELT